MKSPHSQTFEQQFKVFINEAYSGDQILAKACRYALLGPGKRVRPVICYLFSELYGEKAAEPASGAMAVEMIHTYSLIHDDMPCMDDDSERRGRPTVHVQFDEATALLVGDALQTDAFGLLADTPLPNDQKLAALRFLSSAAGSRGMILGQSLDLYWTGRDNSTMADLSQVHSLKTGALLGAAAAIGTLHSTRPDRAVEAYEFGMKIGLAFQIIDDCLDNSANTGKSKGKDIAQNKLTFLKHITKADALSHATELTDRAFRSLDSTAPGRQALVDFCESLLDRDR